MFWELWTKWAMMPCDLAAWSAAVTNRRPPQWATPNRVLLESPFARLRDFSAGGGAVPVLIFPPMAGHSSSIVDYPGQSQVQLVLDHGLTRCYALDWRAATQATTGVTIEDRMAFITRAVNRITRGKINIIGNCQGGWEASIWAALNPGRVNTLITAGSPIDTGTDISPQLLPLIRSLQAMGPAAADAALAGMLALEGGVHRGTSQLAMFMGMNPAPHYLACLRLYNQIREPGAVERFTRFYDWYLHAEDMPGALWKWSVAHLFTDNELYKGTLRVGGARVDLGNITAPVFLLAGEDDDITPPAQQLNMANVVGSEIVDMHLTPGGHLGVFIGHRSQTTVWPRMLAEVAARSRAGVRDDVPAGL